MRMAANMVNSGCLGDVEEDEGEGGAGWPRRPHSSLKARAQRALRGAHTAMLTHSYPRIPLPRSHAPPSPSSSSSPSRNFSVAQSNSNGTARQTRA